MAYTNAPLTIPEGSREFDPHAVRSAMKRAEEYRAELELKRNPPKKSKRKKAKRNAS